MALVPLPSTAPGIRIAHRGATLVCAYLGWPDGASLKAMAEAQATLAKQYGRLTVLAIIPEVGAVLPQPEGERESVVKQSAETGEKLQDTTIASAMVILPKGLLAVMIRSFIGAMSLVSRSRTPLKTFKELAPAIEWLEGHPGANKAVGLQRDVEEWLGVAAARDAAPGA